MRFSGQIPNKQWESPEEEHSDSNKEQYGSYEKCFINTFLPKKTARRYLTSSFHFPIKNPDYSKKQNVEIIPLN